MLHKQTKKFICFQLVLSSSTIAASLLGKSNSKAKLSMDQSKYILWCHWKHTTAICIRIYIEVTKTKHENITSVAVSLSKHMAETFHNTIKVWHKR